ncbi:hypothetical protein [uncultured Acinetobacter sp.]|uniref:hypothetical protein n=1 Tax=uncultured Acinetobacter sp. TaxID=165433 RepID=UPI002620D21D|nr:hypothetical protein [uncultured Acinetobacter sp.]
MRRVVMIVSAVTVIIFAALFYQYQKQQQDVAQLHQYQTVLYEKTEQLYEQAQDWQNPIQLTTQDSRLQGDYRVMADFILSYLTDNAEARNVYLRELKSIAWDQFLDVKRLDQDKKQNYQQTQSMLVNARSLAAQYQSQNEQRHAKALAEAEHLNIQTRLKQTLVESLKSQQDQDLYAVFELEQQILAKAEGLFSILKAHQWQAKNGQFFFYEEQPLKEFNRLYQEVTELNRKIEQIKQGHKAAVEAKL